MIVVIVSILFIRISWQLLVVSKKANPIYRYVAIWYSSIREVILGYKFAAE